VTIWLDAQISPALAPWLAATCAVECTGVRHLGLRDATDREIFLAARNAGAVVMTKDADFSILLTELGPPPQVIWLTCGNTSNQRLREIIENAWAPILAMLNAGESLVEISDRKLEPPSNPSASQRNS
jgi:predicted nuclease of predicted toxin-antitoxin system